MKWLSSPIKEVAPSAASKINFSDSDQVWHLNLDQIESQTGKILKQKIAPASSAGNSTYAFDTKNVLYSKLRPYLNKVVCPEQPGIATTELVPLCPNPKVLDRKFLTYFLRSNRFLYFASTVVAGAKMPRVIMAKFWDYEIPLPPISEQRRIVEILDQADRLRKLRADADAKAQRILPALFIKMFGDPATNPMGWPVRKMGSLAVDLRYGTSIKCSSEEIGLPVIRIPNVIKGRIDLNDIKFGEPSKNEIDSLMLNQGDILFVRTNGNRDYVGRCAVFDLDGNYIYASYLIRARLFKEKVDPKFVISYLLTPTGRQAMAPFIRTTAGQSNISQEGLKQIPIPLPPIEKQKMFCRKVEESANLINLGFIRFEKIELLFTILLHRAFTGDLTASWREAHMKELLQEMERKSSFLEKIK